MDTVDGPTNRESVTRDSSVSDLYATVDKKPVAVDNRTKKLVTTTTTQRFETTDVYTRVAKRGQQMVLSLTFVLNA
jgi:hypothetical protein